MTADAGASPRPGPQGAPVGVVVALALERRSLAGRARDRGTAQLHVVQSGPGAERAAAAAREAIRAGVSALLSWGIAGGLAAAGRPGHVLVPSRIVASDGRGLSVDERWRRAFLDRLGAGFDRLDGPLASVDRVLTTPAAKACTAAITGAVAADMESAAIATVAAEHGLPFLAVRVIADGFDDALPRRIDAWVTPAGDATLTPLPRTLFAPRELRELLRLALKSRAAARVLTMLAPLLAGPDTERAQARTRPAEIVT